MLILHSLFVAGLRDLHLPPDVKGQVLQDVVAAEKAQVLETISTSWDATRLRIVTDGIAGSQWSAYLRVMWSGTRMEQLSSDVARNFGRVALLAGDITTADPRYNNLPRADRRSVLEGRFDQSPCPRVGRHPDHPVRRRGVRACSRGGVRRSVSVHTASTREPAP